MIVVLGMIVVLFLLMILCNATGSIADIDSSALSGSTASIDASTFRDVNVFNANSDASGSCDFSSYSADLVIFVFRSDVNENSGSSKARGFNISVSDIPVFLASKDIKKTNAL